MRRSAIVTLVLATLGLANQGHAEENRGSADYLLPLCKTWLDFAEKEVETIRDMGRTEPIRLIAAGMCAGFVVGVLETLQSNKQSCPSKDLSNPATCPQGGERGRKASRPVARGVRRARTCGYDGIMAMP